jgi:hypothetical protein
MNVRETIRVRRCSTYTPTKHTVQQRRPVSTTSSVSVPSPCPTPTHHLPGLLQRVVSGRHLIDTTEAIRVQRWNTESDTVAVDMFRELTSAPMVFVLGRPFFINPALKKIIPPPNILQLILPPPIHTISTRLRLSASIKNKKSVVIPSGSTQKITDVRRSPVRRSTICMQNKPSSLPICDDDVGAGGQSDRLQPDCLNILNPMEPKKLRVFRAVIPKWNCARYSV